MPIRKGPDSSPTSGWEHDVRQERIDAAIGSHLAVEGERTYKKAYASAAKMLKAKKQPDEIRKLLHREPVLLHYSASDSPRRFDWAKICNGVREHICRIQEEAVEDALAARPANYRVPPGYGSIRTSNTIVWVQLVVLGWVAFVFGHYLITAVGNGSAILGIVDLLFVATCLVTVIGATCHLLSATRGKYFLIPTAILVQVFLGVYIWFFILFALILSGQSCP